MVDFSEQRRRMVERYKQEGYIKSKLVEEAMLKVPREEFMPKNLRDYAYVDQPCPIPGDGRQTISAPYMYPVTYDALNLKPDERFLEIGAGSGYVATLAREIVGPNGKVIAIEINESTYIFAKENLEHAGYHDVKLILGDGTLGHQEDAPYDAISVTASTPTIPQPLKDQLADEGRLIIPLGEPNYFGQQLVLVKKSEGTFKSRNLMGVVYVPLIGKHGWKSREDR